MLSFFKDLRKREPYDFASILGGMTDEARKVAATWDGVNLSDAHNASQPLAAHYIAFHRALITRPDMVGLLEPSASMANRLALERARETTGKTKVLCSNMSHISIARACQSLGLEPIVVDDDPNNNYQVNDETVRQAISQHGQDLAAVVSTYGTTQLGHIEQLAGNKRVQALREDGVWIHVDAAYGGYIGNLSKYVKPTIPPADSVTIDSYKFIGKPGVALLLLERDKMPTTDVPYYDQSPFTLHTTLSAGPLAAWQQTFDDVTLPRLADGCVEVARRVADDLVRYGVSLIQYPEMSIVPVALASAEEVAHIKGALREKMFDVGKVHIKGRGYETHGIRVVITPKVDPELMYGTSTKLAEEIGRLVGK